VTQERELEDKLEKPDLMILSGSRLYGTATHTSDYDYRGFTVPPFEYLAGLSNFEHRVIREPSDTVIYSIKRFFQLLISGDPVAYEILFAPETNIIERSDIGGVILRNRSLFACQRFARRIGGYSQSEWRKVTGTQLVPVARTPNEAEVIEDIRQMFRPQKEEMDEIIRLLFLQHPRETRPARRKLGAKRKAQIERHGYCTSSACHTIRLLSQLVELMDTGVMKFPCMNAELLLSIKQGKLSLGEVVTIYEELLNTAFQAGERTNLRQNPPVNKIKTIYNEIIAHTIITDERVKKYAERYVDTWERW